VRERLALQGFGPLRLGQHHECAGPLCIPRNALDPGVQAYVWPQIEMRREALEVIADLARSGILRRSCWEPKFRVRVRRLEILHAEVELRAVQMMLCNV
jgi:hypothetical protein